MSVDSRFRLDERFATEDKAESSSAHTGRSVSPERTENDEAVTAASLSDEEMSDTADDIDGNDSMRVMKPLDPKALEMFNAAQARSGVVYISRIPPGMRPTKIRHLMSGYGEVGRVFLQQENAKTAYLRKKFTSTKKPHYTEGWVEFKDKKVARSVAELLNAASIGGKKGTRWRDDVWTMKYLPKFKWNMLTEQVAHEAAIRTARLRAELTQSRHEQHDYLKNVELARVLDKRKKAKGFLPEQSERRPASRKKEVAKSTAQANTSSHDSESSRSLSNVLSSVF